MGWFTDLLDDFRRWDTRRNFLRANRPQCPSCKGERVKLLDQLPTAIWKCSRCWCVFTHEPPCRFEIGRHYSPW